MKVSEIIRGLTRGGQDKKPPPEKYPPFGPWPKETGKSVPQLNNELQRVVRDEPKPP